MDSTKALTSLKPFFGFRGTAGRRHTWWSLSFLLVQDQNGQCEAMEQALARTSMLSRDLNLPKIRHLRALPHCPLKVPKGHRSSSWDPGEGRVVGSSM